MPLCHSGRITIKREQCSVNTCYRIVPRLLRFQLIRWKKDEKGGQGHISASRFHKSATRHRAVKNHSFTRILFRLRISFCLQWMAKPNIHVSVTDEGQLKMTKVQGTKNQKNKRKFGIISRTHSRRQLLNNPWARRSRWYQSRSLRGDLNRKFEYASHYLEIWSPNPDKWSKTAARKHVTWATREE
jgi:hypothetical protein